MYSAMDSWTRLEHALAELPREALASPLGGRLGAVLVLLADRGDGDVEVVLTRRRDDLATHPGQISFPGGRVELGETVEDAALREASEEVAVDPATVEILGRLPAFYVSPSRFWVQPVVARWTDPHPMTAAEAEVDEVLQVPLHLLRDRARWRRVQLAPLGAMWAWQLDARHLLWGATAGVMAAVLDMVDPAWHGGSDPASLAPDREVRPWDVRPTPGPPRLPGLEERPAATLRGRPASSGDPAGVRAAARAVTDAVARMGEPAGSEPVLVLAGGGVTGAVGLVASQLLADAAHGVRVLLDRPAEQLSPLAAGAAEAVGGRVRVFDGRLPAAGIVVDALVGTGLRGPLTGTARDVVHALRHLVAPVLAVDLPSGLHPERGLVGECVPADVTLALGLVRPGLLRPGLGPFVGDLYLADTADRGPTVRVVRDTPARRPA